MTKEQREITSVIKNGLRWVGVDMYGITVYQKKPKLIKEKLGKKKGDNRFFAFFDCNALSDEYAEIKKFDYKKNRNIELEQNPRLYRIKLETVFLE